MRFREAGWTLVHGRSDWWFRPGDAAVQAVLVDDWAAAAAALAPQARTALAAWRGRRHDLIKRGRSRLRIGHVDLLALPPDAAP